jgi:hypothetical protein
MSRSFWLYQGKSHILDGDHDLELASMGNNRAIWFARLTNALAEHYSLPPCIREEMDCWGDHQAEGNKFCQVVETVFNHKEDALYELPEVKYFEGLNGWARYAAGVYQIIRDRIYDWNWESKEEPCYSTYASSYEGQPFSPVQYATTNWPTIHSGEKIGKEVK